VGLAALAGLLSVVAITHPPPPETPAEAGARLEEAEDKHKRRRSTLRIGTPYVIKEWCAYVTMTRDRNALSLETTIIVLRQRWRMQTWTTEIYAMMMEAWPDNSTRWILQTRLSAEDEKRAAS
jgi:hypothetical protein